MRNCPRCKQNKELNEFYNRRNKIGNSVYCKKCTTNQTIERQKALKKNAVKYKGGKCQNCGYNKCNSALEFHHVNPNEKDFSLSNVKLTSWSIKIKQELDKCILLCSNCHREEHVKISSLGANG